MNMMNSVEAPRFENCRELFIAGFNESYTAETRMSIPLQWKRFEYVIDSIPKRSNGNAYGVCWNEKPGCRFDYLTGVEVSGVGMLPPEYTYAHIPAQLYAVFIHREHVSAIAKMIDAIRQQWLPKSGYKIANAPMFELYTEAFDPKTGTGGVEIWLPVV